MKEKYENRRLSSIMQVFCFVLLTASLLGSEALSWEIVKEKNGIKVFARPNPGSNIDEFKGVAVMNVKIETILSLLEDIEDEPTWMDKCIEGRLVKKISDFERIVYNVTELPWPCSDRDVVVHQRAKFDDKGGVNIEFVTEPNDHSWVPRSEERVRMTTLKGNFILEPVDNQHTKFTYIIKVDPAGKIPTWMANYASRFIPYNTLKNIIELTQTPAYLAKVKKSRARNSAFVDELMKSRVRSESDKIADKELIDLLQKDKKLLKMLSNSDDETIVVLQKRIDSNYTKENGQWVFKTN